MRTATSGTAVLCFIRSDQGLHPLWDNTRRRKPGGPNGRELCQPFPVETDAVAVPRGRRCHALVEHERVLDIAIEPKTVRAFR
jgi:hypothetical protein